MASPATTTAQEPGKQNIDMMIMQAKASQKGKERRTMLGAARGLSKRLMLKKQQSGFIKCCECNRTVAWGGFAKSQRTKIGGTTCRKCKVAAAKSWEETNGGQQCAALVSFKFKCSKCCNMSHLSADSSQSLSIRPLFMLVSSNFRFSLIFFYNTAGTVEIAWCCGNEKRIDRLLSAFTECIVPWKIHLVVNLFSPSTNRRNWRGRFSK